MIVCPRDNVGQTLARRTLQAVGLFRVGDDLGVEAAGAGGVKDADSFVVAAKHARAVAAERHAVRGRHLIHRVVGPVGGAQLPADCVPKMQRVRLPHRDSRDPSGHWPVYHELHDASPCMHTRCSLGIAWGQDQGSKRSRIAIYAPRLEQKLPLTRAVEAKTQDEGSDASMPGYQA